MRVPHLIYLGWVVSALMGWIAYGQTQPVPAPPLEKFTNLPEPRPQPNVGIGGGARSGDSRGNVGVGAAGHSQTRGQ